MSFGQAVRGASSFFPDEAKGIVRRNKAQQERPSESKPSSRADFERSLAVFKCTADVDAGHGRRLRREKQPMDGTLLGLPTKIGCEEDPRGLPKRRLRRATRLSCHTESEEVSGRRAFFDQFTRAEEYAELIGRPFLSPRPKEQSLLVEMDYILEKDGDIEDASTAASDDHERLRKDSMPSLQVRRMLQSLQPGKGSPKLDIPLEMVARLEQLVELADRVESKRRIRSRVLREVSATPDYQESTPTEASLPEVLPEEEEKEEEEARPSVQFLVQKYESPWPTLLRRQESSKPQAPCDDPAEKSVAASEGTDMSSPRLTDQELMDKSNALRRKGFNLLPQARGHCWDELTQVTML